MRELKQDWRDIFLGFRVALDARKLLLALAGIALFIAGTSVITLVLSYVWGGRFEGLPWKWEFFTTTQRALAPDIWNQPWFQRLLTIIMYACWGALIWPWFGGAISRIVSVELAKDERIEISEALAFAGTKFRSFFWSPIAPILAIIFFFLCIFVLGLLCKIPGLGGLLMIVFFPLALVAGFVIALIVLGVAFGMPLMYPTISTEGTDSFDAISRSFSYVYSRPWRYAFYNIAAVLYAVPIFAFVYAFAHRLSWGAASSTIKCAMGVKGVVLFDYVWNTIFDQPGVLGATSSLGWWQHVVATVLLIYAGIVGGLIVSYFVSFYYSVSGIVYLLMRKRVDGTDATEIFLEDEDIQVVEVTPSSATSE